MVSVHTLPRRITRRTPVLIIALLAMIQTGPELRAHGTYHDLVELLDREREQHPEDATLHLRYAALHLEHEDWQSALVSLEHGRRQGLAETELSLLEGQALAQAKQWRSARTALDAFLTAHPGNLTALVSRARVLLQLKEIEPALTDYLQALQSTERQQPELFIEAADALWSAHRQDEALKVLASAEAKFGAAPQIVLKAMDWELAMGRHEDALRCIDRMQQVTPRREPWMLKRASVLAQAGRIHEARVCFRQLQQHIAALPHQERASHAMCLIAEQAGIALTALSTSFTPPHSTAP